MLLALFLIQAEGEDSLKKMQLMELAILNGTYRDANIKSRKNATGARTTASRLFVRRAFSFGGIAPDQMKQSEELG